MRYDIQKRFEEVAEQAKAEGRQVEFKTMWPLYKEMFEPGLSYYMEDGEKNRRAVIIGTKFGPVVLMAPDSNVPMTAKMQAPDQCKQILVYQRPNEIPGEIFIMGYQGLKNIGEWIEEYYE